MEEVDKRIGNGGETFSRVSADSSSWLFSSRQRFTIELRPGETTIVSWKRLVKDAQNTSSHLTASKTEDSLDECFQDSKSTVKQNGLLVNSEKLDCINEPVLSVARQSRKRSKNIAKDRGEKVDGHLPSKHAKLEQERLSCAANNGLLEEESSSVILQNLADSSQSVQKLHKQLNSSVRSSVKKPANIETKSECASYTGISNDDASISPLKPKDADNYRSVTIHSSNIGNHTNSVVTNQTYLEKSCKQLESPMRKSMTDNKEKEIPAKVELMDEREAFGELPDLNLPVDLAQPEVSNCISNFQQHMRT